MVGTKALVIVDGNAPKIVAVGESIHGVKLVSVQDNTAIMLIAGKPYTLRVGEAPANVEHHPAGGHTTKIVIPMSGGGHFMAQGSINGVFTQFMVDTGATSVALSAAEAKRIGLDYTSGQPMRINTANGQAIGYLLKLASVRIGQVDIPNVDAIVSPQPMPYVLLGNSFLTRFSMHKESDVMVLERRY
jgi:aspartyl protease family protein